MVREPVELPSPGIVFGPDFLARLGRLAAELASVRERREGEGPARLFGVGSEFVGYRPYRSGEDLRALDWNLLARLGRPYVRVAAREASEAWAVLLDTSASMGVGRPGKLQLGAELALALATLGLARRAKVALHTSGPAPLCVARRRAALEGWMRALTATRAAGSAGLGNLARAFAAARSGARVAGRVFLIGDFLDCEPREVFALARPARELFLVQVLAPEELVPPARGAVRWVDAESGSALVRGLDEHGQQLYEQRLAARLELWRAAAARARAVHGCWTSTTPFETLARALCARMG
jgi:uncharacterized protein (DUF58 family)